MKFDLTIIKWFADQVSVSRLCHLKKENGHEEPEVFPVVLVQVWLTG
jgi:hypothetical protein